MFLRRKKSKSDFEIFAGRVDGKNCRPFSLTVDLVFSQNGTPWIIFNGENDRILKSNSLEEVLLEIDKHVKEHFTS